MFTDAGAVQTKVAVLGALKAADVCCTLAVAHGPLAKLVAWAAPIANAPSVARSNRPLNGCVPVTLTVYVCEATYVAGNVTDHAVDRGAAEHIDVDAKYDGGPTLHADAAAPLENACVAGSNESNRDSDSQRPLMVDESTETCPTCAL